MELADRILILARNGLRRSAIAAILNIEPGDVAASLRDPTVVPEVAETPELQGIIDRLGTLESAPAPATTPALGQLWRDVTSERARGAWYQPHPTRAVLLNWTFVNPANTEVDINIRVADDPAHYADAVFLTADALHPAINGGVANFVSLIPAGMYVQAYGTAGWNFSKALELTL